MFKVWLNSQGDYCAARLECENPVSGVDVFQAESFYIFSHKLHERLLNMRPAQLRLVPEPRFLTDQLPINEGDFDASD